MTEAHVAEDDASSSTLVISLIATVAAADVIVPHWLMMSQLYAPASALVAFATAYSAFVAPLMAAPSFFH